MNERISVWAARFVLLVPALVGLVWSMFLPADHAHLWPFGTVPYVGDQILIFVGFYVIGGLIAIAATFWALVTTTYVVETLFSIAWRREHIPLRKRWSVFDAPNTYKGPMVTYSKPQSLIKGRTGSK